LETFAELERCVELQRVIWGPDVDQVPAAELVVIRRYGGLVIGAFDGDDLVGFVCGMVGRHKDRVFHHSHLLGVLPAYRGRGIGEELKWAQRDRVLSQGMDLINWTFDPLQSLNANLNINHLGAVIKEYLLNVYGESLSSLHGGLPTDRFEAEWRLESARVRSARQGRRPQWPGWEQLPRANQTRHVGELLRCEGVRLDLDAQAVLLEVPPAITTIMKKDRELALDWRLQTRRALTSYLGRGYAVVGFHRSETGVFYRLVTERRS